MKLGEWSRVTDEEYRANVTGMNTFFGAVIGFVLADVETADLRGFATMLLVTAAIVISILYISVSVRRWFYAALTLFLISALPRLLRAEPDDLGRLQVTLAVWTLMSVMLEAWWAWQRRRDARSDAGDPA